MKEREGMKEREKEGEKEGEEEGNSRKGKICKISIFIFVLKSDQSSLHLFTMHHVIFILLDLQERVGVIKNKKEKEKETETETEGGVCVFNAIPSLDRSRAQHIVNDTIHIK